VPLLSPTHPPPPPAPPTSPRPAPPRAPAPPPAHLYFKRAKSSELLFGDPTYHRELLAQRIGI
jgi:hypothetical protein